MTCLKLGYQLTISYFYASENTAEQLRSIKTIPCVVMIRTAVFPALVERGSVMDIEVKKK